MQIRIAVQSDVPEIHRIRMSVRENVLQDPDSIQPSDTLRMITRDGRGWVCDLNGRTVGFAIADLIQANVWALFVEPEHERRGIGRRLHDVMLDWLFERGAETVWLTTVPGTRAEGFYQTAGWRFAGRERNGEVRYEITREQWDSASAT